MIMGGERLGWERPGPERFTVMGVMFGDLVVSPRLA